MNLAKILMGVSISLRCQPIIGIAITDPARKGEPGRQRDSESHQKGDKAMLKSKEVFVYEPDRGSIFAHADRAGD